MEFPRDVGASLEVKHALVIPTVTAGGGGDGAEVNGEVIDRQDALSATFAVLTKATLGAGETMITQLTLQHGDAADGSDMADVDATLQPGGAAASAVNTLTGGSGGTTEEGAYQFDVDLSSLKRYMRVQTEPTLSRANTDTGTVAVACVLGGRSVDS